MGISMWFWILIAVALICGSIAVAWVSDILFDWTGREIRLAHLDHIDGTGD
jgi:hypothetical protein